MAMLFNPLHSERPKLHSVLAVLNAIGLTRMHVRHISKKFRLCKSQCKFHKTSESGQTEISVWLLSRVLWLLMSKKIWGTNMQLIHTSQIAL